MKSKRWMQCVAMVLIIGLLAVGCGTTDGGEKKEEGKTEKKDSYKIAIVPNSLNDPYMIILLMQQRHVVMSWEWKALFSLQVQEV